ncbi:MAG: hypothetical protein HC902_12565 [Calothrix sp. SM1_5_4]|nr:hypothetical protein [Calothrix sp. SM1_5_4]
MRALILSAGLGERLRPLTNVRAKPAIEFLNMPMLTFPYYWLNTLELSDITFNTHYLPETIRHAAMRVVDPAIRLHFTHEETILGSGGGIWNSRFHLQGDSCFAVANGDGVIVCKEDDVLVNMLKFHQDQDALATLLVCPLDGVGTRIPGVWMTSDGEVMNFGLEARGPGMECLHYASFMLLNERIWNYLPRGSPTFSTMSCSRGLWTVSRCGRSGSTECDGSRPETRGTIWPRRSVASKRSGTVQASAAAYAEFLTATLRPSN